MKFVLIVIFALLLVSPVFAGEKEDLAANIALYKIMMTKWEGQIELIRGHYMDANEAVRAMQRRISQIATEEARAKSAADLAEKNKSKAK